MKLRWSYLLLTGIILLFNGCFSEKCGPEHAIDITNIDLLEKTEFKSCVIGFNRMSQSVFNLTEDQTDQLLDDFEFEPIRKSTEPIETPFGKLNEMMEELDRMHRYELDVDDEDLQCNLILKEDDGMLIISINKKQ